MKLNKGFTLIELMIVVAIMAIMAAILLPVLRGKTGAARGLQAPASVPAAPRDPNIVCREGLLYKRNAKGELESVVEDEQPATCYE